jgi:hypothetical protein
MILVSSALSDLLSCDSAQSFFRCSADWVIRVAVHRSVARSHPCFYSASQNHTEPCCRTLMHLRLFDESAQIGRAALAQNAGIFQSGANCSWSSAELVGPSSDALAEAPFVGQRATIDANKFAKLLIRSSMLQTVPKHCCDQLNQSVAENGVWRLWQFTAVKSCHRSGSGPTERSMSFARAAHVRKF